MIVLDLTFRQNNDQDRNIWFSKFKAEWHWLMMLIVKNTQQAHQMEMWHKSRNLFMKTAHHYPHLG